MAVDPDGYNGSEPQAKPTDMVYTKESFEEFLQQAELSGISRKRQDELMVMVLAQDVSLEDVILNLLAQAVNFLRKKRLVILVLMVVFGVAAFALVNEYRSRAGYQDYKPWQLELSAFLKEQQIKYFSFFDWNAIFSAECFVDNPYWFLMNPREPRDVDCKENPRILTVADAKNYEGIFNSKKFPLPLLLTKALDDWPLGPQSSLEDLYTIIGQNLKIQPCATYLEGAEADPDLQHDPLRALIDGRLARGDGTPINLVLFEGCSGRSNKLLRSLTKRPIFMAAHAESLKNVYAIAAKGGPEDGNSVVTIRNFTPGDVQFVEDAEYTWLAQVIGTSTITVRDQECPDNPPEIHKMQPGDIVTIAPEDALDIKVSGPEESLLIYTDFKVRN